MIRTILCFTSIISLQALAQQDQAAVGRLMPHDPTGTATSMQAMPVLLDEDFPTLELVSFDAATQGEAGVLVRWATLSEAPTERFVVERSADRLNWHPAAALDGQGEQDEYTTYEAVDEAPIDGISYYRLCREEPNGTLTEVSDLFAVRHDVGMDLLIHADHIPGRFTVVARGNISDVRLLNNRGQFVPMELQLEGERVRVNAEELPSGTYYVQVTVDGNAHMRPVIISGGTVMGG